MNQQIRLEISLSKTLIFPNCIASILSSKRSRPSSFLLDLISTNISLWLTIFNSTVDSIGTSSWFYYIIVENWFYNGINSKKCKILTNGRKTNKWSPAVSLKNQDALCMVPAIYVSGVLELLSLGNHEITISPERKDHLFQ